jgi:hypothetical protein
LFTVGQVTRLLSGGQKELYILISGIGAIGIFILFNPDNRRDALSILVTE